MKKKKIFILIAMLPVVLLIALFLVNSGSREPHTAAAPGDTAKEASRLHSIFGENNFVSETGCDEDSLQFIAVLKERYSSTMERKRTRVRLIGGLLRYLKKKYPHDWRDRIHEIITNEFPEYSDLLLASVDTVEQYRDFIKNGNELRDLSYAERKEKIWEKRQELFGDDYKEIWDYEIKKGQVALLLEKINANKDLAFHDKIKVFKDVTADIYVGGTSSEQNRTVSETRVQQYKLTKQFLGMGSVQEELSTMDGEEKARALRELRLSMGMDEETVGKLGEADILRDNIWGKSAAYMMERKKLVSEFHGEALAAGLENIRKKYFGTAATFIRFEEESLGKFRFSEPRKWGRD
ncbi:MAG: hypothetical protein GY754_22530 [bacterium]|nr:hypothetical protein [bacterium]